MGHGDYRKHNDGSMSSSTYHKRDGTPVRQLLKREAEEEVSEEESVAEGGEAQERAAGQTGMEVGGPPA